MSGNWIDYNKHVSPPHPQTLVCVRFKNDGHETVPIKAEEIDWDLDHVDPVGAYTVIAPFTGVVSTRKQEKV